MSISLTHKGSDDGNPRWLVELTSGEFEDVGAEDLVIDAGTLIFTNRPHNKLAVAYNPSQWRTVVQE